jgi:hypothetical protein
MTGPRRTTASNRSVLEESVHVERTGPPRDVLHTRDGHARIRLESAPSEMTLLVAQPDMSASMSSKPEIDFRLIRMAEA